MQLDDLEALLAVTRHGSFQAAAWSLGVPRTRLRRQLDRLERELGSPLLHRGARGVRPTAAGEHLAERASGLLARARALLDGTRAAAGAAAGTLRMVVPVGTPTPMRVRALRTLQALHPEVALDVVEADAPLDLLSTPFDLMMHFGPPPSLDGWYSRVLLRLTVGLWASPDYLERHGEPASPEELAGHRLATWRVGRGFAQRWPLRGGGDVAVAPAVLSANPELLFALTAQSGCIALLPASGELFDPTRSGLSPVLPEEVGGELDVRVLTPTPSRADPRLRAVLENARGALDSFEVGAAGGLQPDER